MEFCFAITVSTGGAVSTVSTGKNPKEKKTPLLHLPVGGPLHLGYRSLGFTAKIMAVDLRDR